jgi:hypothetical protein
MVLSESAESGDAEPVDSTWESARRPQLNLSWPSESIEDRRRHSEEVVAAQPRCTDRSWGQPHDVSIVESRVVSDNERVGVASDQMRMPVVRSEIGVVSVPPARSTLLVPILL